MWDTDGSNDTFDFIYEVSPTSAATTSAQLLFKAQKNTGGYSSVFGISDLLGVYMDRINRLSDSSERITFTATETVFNENGDDYNFRIESMNNEYIFYVDAEIESGQGIVSIRTNASDSVLNVFSDSSSLSPAMFRRLQSATATDFEIIQLQAYSTGDIADGFGGYITWSQYDSGAGNVDVVRAGARRDGADNSGEFVIQTAFEGSFADNFRVRAGGGIFMPNIKSGADQSAAGAAADELYHDTDDHTIKIGV